MLRRAIIAVILITTFIIVTGLFFIFTPEPKTAIPPHNICVPEGVYFGVWLPFEDMTVNTKAYEEFSKIKKPSMGVVYSSWNDFWPILQWRMDTLYNLNITPHIVWEPYINTRGKDILQFINDGDFDSHLEKLAIRARDYQKPIFIRMMQNMNLNISIWSGSMNGGPVTTGYGDPSKPDGPERYIDAWRRVVDIFRKNGAENLIWVWSVIPYSVPYEDWNRPENYYPGDDYVDWIGLSVFGLFWDEKNPIKVIPEALSALPNKPLMISEASANYRDKRDPFARKEWISNLFSAIENESRIHAFIWFNEDKSMYGETDWRIESDMESLNTFKERIMNPIYLSTACQGASP